MWFKSLLASLIVVSTVVATDAKDKNGYIMKVDGEEIPTEEFIYLFQKNNTQQQQPQSLDEYLDLFEIYRLKVAEARKEGVDTAAAFKKEIRQYKRELVEPYVTDTAFINRLVDIAAEREKWAVESSHIMIIRTHDEEKDKRNLELLDSIRLVILNGGDFIELAKKYSQDRFSSQKGGYLGFTPAGTFPYGFETVEYETPEGEISDIVESHVGWHIIKAGSKKPAEELNFPIRSYQEIKEDVLRKSTSPFDSRFFEIRSHNMDKLKELHPKLAEQINALPEDEAFEVLMQAEEDRQYSNNSEYRNLVDEYINGSLLYEISVKNVWDKAASDEEGLNEYYADHKDKYKWVTPHAKGVLVQALNDSVANEIKGAVMGMSPEETVKYMKANFKKEATAGRFNLAEGDNPMVDNVMFNGEPVKPKVPSFTTYFVLDGRIVDSPEEMNDVRGKVVADYQDKLEEEWVKRLREKHSVEINKKELSRVRKSFK